MPCPARPLPSISTELTPRRASWAARIVPDAPPPTIATGTTRSDFVVRPGLRICSAGFALDHVIVHPLDRLARGLGEPRRNRRMDDAGGARADQLGADLDRADAVTRPAHAQRARVFKEHAVHDPVLVVRNVRLIGRHHPCPPNVWRPRQDSNLWPTD